MRLAGVERRRRGQKACAAMRCTQPLDDQGKTDEPGTGDRHAAARKFCRPPRPNLFVDGSRGGGLATLALAPGYLLAAPSALKAEPWRRRANGRAGDLTTALEIGSRADDLRSRWR